MTDAFPRRRAAAYWLTLAFRLSRSTRRDRNGLVLTADRRAGLALLDLARLDPGELPPEVARFDGIHRRLVEADGEVASQAFVAERLSAASVELMPITHPAYPEHLGRRLGPSKAPTLLSVAGNPAILCEPGVAVSGSRKAGQSGLAFAYAAGRAIAEAGMTLVSGLARGIDTAALDGALEAGGRAIGVAAEGIMKSKAMRHPAVADGHLVVVSEFAPMMRWAGWAAMQRNKTIAGLSRALIIADCVGQGGTTAQFEDHRSLDMPVFIRRGPGEGALMAELAARPGATPLHWSQGPLRLPAVLTGSPEEPADEQPDLPVVGVRREGGRLLISIDARADTPPDALMQALAEHLGVAPMSGPPTDEIAQETSTSETEEPEAEPAQAEPMAQKDDAQDQQPMAEPAQSASTEDPVLAALATTPDATVSVLAQTVERSKDRVRRRLRSLEEAGRVEADRSKRPHKYRLRNSGRSSSHRAPSQAPSQLGLMELP